MRQVAHVCHTMSSRLDMAKEPMAPGATTRELGEKADEIIACNEKSNPPNFDSASTENRQDEQNLEAQNGRQRHSLWRRFNPLRLQRVPDVPEERPMSREYGASLLSRIFFLWVVPFMKVGDSCFGRGMHVSHTYFHLPDRLPSGTRGPRHPPGQPFSIS